MRLSPFEFATQHERGVLRQAFTNLSEMLLSASLLKPKLKRLSERAVQLLPSEGGAVTAEELKLPIGKRGSKAWQISIKPAYRAPRPPEIRTVQRALLGLAKALEDADWSNRRPAATSLELALNMLPRISRRWSKAQKRQKGKPLS